MDELKARLTEAGLWYAELEAEIKALYKYGINCIKDEKLRDTVWQFLCIVPVRFFIDPASRSGRFHPPWQLGRHGRLRSIVESCVLLPALAQYIPEILDGNFVPNNHALDIAFAATIISDTWINEDQGDIHHGPDHGRVAAEHWRAFALTRGLYYLTVEEVAEGAAWHYGIYTPDWTPEHTFSPVAYLVHLCDAITAQRALALIYDGKAVVE